MTGYRRLEHITPMPQAETGILRTTAFAIPPLEMLRGGTLDARIMAEPSYPDDMTRFQLVTEPFVVAFTQGHPFEKMATVPLEAFVEYPSINWSLYEFPRYLAFRTGIATWPKDAPASPHLINDKIICQSLISGGACVAVVQESLLLKGVRNRRLTRPAISSEIGIVTRARSTLCALLREQALACVPRLQHPDDIAKLKPGILQQDQHVKQQIGSLISHFSAIILHPR